MNDFKNNILKGIKTGEIKAESRWRFLAHDYFFWVLTGVSTILGAVAISSTLHRIAIDQVPLAPHLRDFESVSILFQTIPYVWILAIVLLGFAGWFNFKKTSKAYKHQLVVFLSMLVASMILGGVLFGVGVGSKVDEGIRNRVPVFEKQRIKRQELRNQYIQKRQERLQNADTERLNPIAPPRRVRSFVKKIR